MITENYTGSSASGNSGDQNRTLTINNTSLTNDNNFQIYVNNSFLHLNTDYTIVHNSSSSVVTFLNSLWDDQNISLIYYTVSSTIGSLTSEDYDGSDTSGSDGDSNRTLTLSNTKITSSNNFQVYVNNAFLHPNVDYTTTHNSSSSVITFLNPVFDSQKINVRYVSITETTPLTEKNPILPLDTQISNNEINYFGDTIKIKRIDKLDEDSYGNAQLVYGDSKVSYTSGDDSSSDFYDTNWIAQTFSHTESLEVVSVKIKVLRTGTPSTITIGIQAVDGNNKPDGTDLTSGSLDYTDLIDDGDTEWITIPLTAYNLTANTTYAIVIREASGDSSNKYSARIKTTGTYSSGNNLTSDNSGSTWTAGSSDILFEIFGTTSTVAVSEVLTHSDDAVKMGQFQSGDKRFFLQNSESISLGDQVYHDGKWYQIDSLENFSMGNTNYSYEIICKKI